MKVKFDKMVAEILIVDDESDIRMQISGILEDEGFETRMAANSAQAFNEVAARQPALIILDVWLNNSEFDGLQILEVIKQEHPALPVIMISGHGTFDMAVKATKIGAYDFITKPFKTDVLLHIIDRALGEARLRRENQDLKQRIHGGMAEQFIGSSPGIQEVQKNLEKVAPTDSRVLITGAPGTGKSLAARLIHKFSNRKKRPYISLNCAGLEAEGFEDILFGREADDRKLRRVGLLEEAHGGTLLLDEIADLPADTQSKIVRVLHNQKFQRVGGDSWIEVNVRVIATSNKNLEKLMQDGLFREDLFYRLNVVPLPLPLLASRREDIPELAKYFMQRSAVSKGRSVLSFSQDALTMLQGYDWPGNIWELINIVERLLLTPPAHCEETVGADDILTALGETKRDSRHIDPASTIMNQPLREAREAFEREYLLFHLARFSGNISRTAESVGMDRAALHRKLKGLGIQNIIKSQHE